MFCALIKRGVECGRSCLLGEVLLAADAEPVIRIRAVSVRMIVLACEALLYVWYDFNKGLNWGMWCMERDDNTCLGVSSVTHKHSDTPTQLSDLHFIPGVHNV